MDHNTRTTVVVDVLVAAAISSWPLTVQLNSRISFRSAIFRTSRGHRVPSLLFLPPRYMRPGIVGMRGSIVLPLRPCMTWVHPPFPRYTYTCVDCAHRVHSAKKQIPGELQGNSIGLWLYSRLTLTPIRGATLIRTPDGPQNPYILLFLHTIVGPDYYEYVPP